MPLHLLGISVALNDNSFFRYIFAFQSLKLCIIAHQSAFLFYFGCLLVFLTRCGCGTWEQFSGGCGSSELTAGLDGCRGLFQPKQFHDSMTLKECVAGLMV